FSDGERLHFQLIPGVNGPCPTKKTEFNSKYRRKILNLFNDDNDDDDHQLSFKLKWNYINRKKDDNSREKSAID
ncbi:hypothetical protein RDWZM_004140, partial [Blomia tropicalis]